MTKDELIKIFQEVNRDLLEEHMAEKISENFQSHCKPDANGQTSMDEIVPAIMLTMNDYNQDFLFRVLAKALCKN